LDLFGSSVLLSQTQREYAKSSSFSICAKPRLRSFIVEIPRKIP
jgi:hypothetical protein